MFVLLFKNGDNDPTENSFDKYCMPLLEIKVFNAVLDVNHFLIKWYKTNKEEEYEELIQISRNNDYTTGNLLHDLYYQNQYKLIGIDFSANTSILQQINFVGKVEKDDDASIFFTAEKQ